MSAAAYMLKIHVELEMATPPHRHSCSLAGSAFTLATPIPAGYLTVLPSLFAVGFMA